MKPFLAFGDDEAERAARLWGLNCGPAALAAIAGVSLEAVRGMIPGFEARRYTSPTMMRAGVAAAGLTIVRDDRGRVEEAGRLVAPALIRVQWGGPWTERRPDGSVPNPRWGYRATHWIATAVGAEVPLWIFDVNAGWTTPADWQGRVVPMLTATIRRASGAWWTTHTWTVRR